MKAEKFTSDFLKVSEKNHLQKVRVIQKLQKNEGKYINVDIFSYITSVSKNPGQT